MEDAKRQENSKTEISLDLNEHHQTILKSYIQFARYLRQQNLKSIDLSFQDVIESRILESTYTQTEVTQLVNNLKQLIMIDIENELIHFSHINCLLLKQLFTQAEKWYLYLNIDSSEIQNKHLLEIMKSLDNSNETDVNQLEIKTIKLQPLEEIHIEKISQVLKGEIENLKQTNLNLNINNENIKIENIKLKQEKEEINKILNEKETQLNNLTNKFNAIQTEGNEMKNNEHHTKQIQTVLNDFEQVLNNQLSEQLINMKKDIVITQSQLSLAQQELERKFNQTMAYNNMKKMITKKNEQIKQLRNQLLKYEPDLTEPDETETYLLSESN